MGNSSLRTFIAALAFAAIASTGCASIFQPTTVNGCFTPDGGCTDAIVAEISKAQDEILVQAYSFTAKALADAIVAAQEAGVSIQIILDRSYSYTQNSASYFSTMKGIPTYLDAQHGVARSNVIIIDKKTVLTGGVSFTNEADDRYAENLVIIRSAGVAKEYLQNWEKHKGHSELYTPQAKTKPFPKKGKRPAPKAPAKPKSN